MITCGAARPAPENVDVCGGFSRRIERPNIPVVPALRHLLGRQMYKQIFNVVRLVAVLAVLLVFTGQSASDTKAAPTPLTWKPLNLIHGWTSNPPGTYDPAIAIDPSTAMVYLRGGMGTGDDMFPFRIPSAYRPVAGI